VRPQDPMEVKGLDEFNSGLEVGGYITPLPP
jgi:hypothetical protein